MQKPYTKSIDHYGLKDQKSIESDYSNNDIQMADSSEPEIEKECSRALELYIERGGTV